MIKLLLYQTRDGKIPFTEWLLSLKDVTGRARIRARLDRLQLGNFGDSKRIDRNVFELRFHFGSGYRVYYGMDSNVVVVLLCGGDKGSQENDIRKAAVYWQDYLERRA